MSKYSELLDLLEQQSYGYNVNRQAAAALRELETERDALRARVAELKREMRMHLPILNALERKPSAWEWYTDGTGVATLNGYRAALSEKEGE